jgi:hypothetical protein
MWVTRNVYTILVVSRQKKRPFSKHGYRNYKMETKSADIVTAAFLKTGVVPTSETLGITDIPPKMSISNLWTSPGLFPGGEGGHEKICLRTSISSSFIC